MPSIFGRGHFAFSGVMMPEQREPVTVAMAAQRLGKQPGTIRCWASRYGARKYGTYKGQTVYDWNDLSMIGRCLHLREDVPATPEARDELRASLLPAA